MAYFQDRFTNYLFLMMISMWLQGPNWGIFLPLIREVFQNFQMVLGAGIIAMSEHPVWIR